MPPDFHTEIDCELFSMLRRKAILVIFVSAIIAGAMTFISRSSPDSKSGTSSLGLRKQKSDNIASFKAPADMQASAVQKTSVPANNDVLNSAGTLQKVTSYSVEFERALKDAKEGVPGALYRLDNAITACEGVPKDEDGYQKWMAVHATDNMPDFDAMRDLMSRCKDMPTMTFDQRESLYRSYADKGSAEGAYMLGALYGFGSMDSEKWLGKAAREGNVDAASMLAETYASPASDGADNAKAYLWYLVASRLGDKQAAASAAKIADTLDPGKINDAQTQARALAPGIQQVSEN